MRKCYLILAVLLPVFCAVSCSEHGGEVRDMLAAVDTLMDTDLDSALVVTERLDSMRPVMGRKDRAVYGLLRTEVRYLLFLPVKDDTLVFEAVEYFRRRGPEERLSDALMMQGAVQYERGDWASALNSYKEAERVMGNAGDYKRLGLVNARIGEMYGLAFVNSPEAVLRKRKALDYFERTDDLEMIMSARLSLARALLPDSVDEAERYVREGLALAEMLDSRMWTLVGYELMSYCFQVRRDYRGMVDATMAAVEKFGWMSDERSCSQILGKMLSGCAQAYSRLGRPDSARMVMSHIDWQATGVYDSLLACCYMAEAEEDWKALARYRKQAWDMSDSLMEAGVRAQLSQAEKLYDSSRAEADNYRLRYRVRNAVIIIVSVTVCAAALIAVLMMTLGKFRRINRKYVNENESLRKRVDGETPKRMHLETLGRMLALTDSLVDTYYRYRDTSAIAPKVRGVLGEYFDLNDKDGNSVEARVYELCDALYPGLVGTVREQCPELKPRELLTVACLACGFSTGTTAKLRGISEKSLYVERSRIRSLMGCSVQEFIAKIYS